MSGSTDPEAYLLPMPKPGATFTKRSRDRDAEAARLKALGWSLDDIAVQLNMDDAEMAAKAIRRALAAVVRFAGDEMRLMEAQSLEELEAQAWRTLRSQKVMVSNGRVVYDETGEPVVDDRYVLETLDRILKIKERRAKLLGLDAPTRAEVITIDSIESEIAKLERELEAGRNKK